MKLGALGALGALAVLPLLVVMTGLTEGRKISACELRAALRRQVPRWWGTFLIDQVVCYAEYLSGLNTALVKTYRDTPILPSIGLQLSKKNGQRGKREAEQSTDDPLPEEDNDQMEEEEEGDDGEDDATSGKGGEDGKDSSTPSKRKKRSLGHLFWPITSYYGIFQLSDRIYCDSGINPTKNLCKTCCLAFKDNDITDDIRCILKTGYWRHALSRGPSQCHSYWRILTFRRKFYHCP